VAAIMPPTRSRGESFVIAGTALLLLFVGIHNAWDTVTCLAVERKTPKESRDDEA